MKSLLLTLFLSLLAYVGSSQRPNGVLSFDGQDDYAVSNSGMLNGTFTLDFYFRTCSPQTSIIGAPLISSLDTNSNTGFALNLTTTVSGDSASIELVAGDSTSTASEVVVLPIYGRNIFHHIALANDPTHQRMNLYFDGDSVGSLSLDYRSSTGFVLGSNLEQSAYFQGQVTELSIDDTLAFARVYKPPTTYYFDVNKSFWSFDLGDSKHVSSRRDTIQAMNGLRSLALPGHSVSGGIVPRDFCVDGSVDSVDWNQFGSTMLWSDSIDVILNGTSLLLFGDSSRSYQIQFSDSNGCLVDFSFEKNAVYPPRVDLGADTTLCEGDTLILSVDSFMDSGFFAVWNDKNFGLEFPVRQSGEYRVQVGTAGCNSSDTILVIDQPAPSPNLGNDTNLSSGFTVILGTKKHWNSYRWNTIETDSIILATVTGKYWVEVTDSNGCRGADTIRVNIEGSFPYSVKEGVFAHLKIGPNPSSAYVEVQGLEDFTYSLFDLSGKLVAKGVNEVILLPSPGGMYILDLESEGEHQRVEILRLAP